MWSPQILVLPGLLAVCRNCGGLSDFTHPFVADALVIVDEITSNETMKNTKNNDIFALFIY